MAETATPGGLARLGEMIDRHDIHAAIKRISRGIDRFDRDLFLSGYHDDAVIDAGSMVGDPARVYEIGRALHDAGQSATLHHLTNHSCDIDGDTAHAETYFIYVGRNRADADAKVSNWAGGGRYVDRLERRDGEWRVAFRLTIMEWSGSIAANEVPLFAEVPDSGLNGTAARGPEDPSYRRPFTNLRAPRYPDDARALGTPKE